MRTLLLDGDIFAYKVSCANEKSIDWGDDCTSRITDEEAAREQLNRTVDALVEKLEANEVIVCLSDDTRNFRKALLPTYKHNRNPEKKPQMLAGIKAYMAEMYPSFIRDGLEADDVMGILSTAQKIPGEKIIVTIDKDLKTVPGKLYNPNKSEEGIVEITEQQADYWHMVQTLTGDATDGYKGCPGIGPVKAEAILSLLDVDENTLGYRAMGEIVFEPEKVRSHYWRQIVAAYAKVGLTEADALLQARVARILRASDYDFTRKEPILWTPA